MIVDQINPDSNIWKQIDSEYVSSRFEDDEKSMLFLPREVQKKILETAYVLGQKSSTESEGPERQDDDDDEIRDGTWYFNSSYDNFCTYENHDDGFRFDNEVIVTNSSFNNQLDDEDDDMDEPLLGLELLNCYESLSTVTNRRSNGKRFKFPWCISSFISLRRKTKNRNYFVMPSKGGSNLCNTKSNNETPGIMMQEKSIPSLVDISMISEPSVNNDNEIEVVFQPDADEISLTFSEEEGDRFLDYPDDETLEFAAPEIEVTLGDNGQEEVSYMPGRRSCCV
jgi:hypothetical protein